VGELERVVPEVCGIWFVKLLVADGEELLGVDVNTSDCVEVSKPGLSTVKFFRSRVIEFLRTNKSATFGS